MTMIKDKNGSKIYCALRLEMLKAPWIDYPEAHKRMGVYCKVGTARQYGGYVRKEIGATLNTMGGKEILTVDYSKYAAACELHSVKPASLETIHSHATSSRPIVVNVPEAPAAVAPKAAAHDALDDMPSGVGEALTQRLEAAELRCTEANDLVKQLEAQLSTARKEADEAAQALKILDDLASSPIAVIRAILG